MMMSARRIATRIPITTLTAMATVFNEVLEGTVNGEKHRTEIHYLL